MAATAVVEITAGEVADALKRQGISSDERVTLMIEADEEIFPDGARRERESSQPVSPTPISTV